MHRQMLMRESAEQIPHLTQTAIGGNMMAIKPRKRSEEHISMAGRGIAGKGIENGCSRLNE